MNKTLFLLSLMGAFSALVDSLGQLWSEQADESLFGEKIRVRATGYGNNKPGKKRFVRILLFEY